MDIGIIPEANAMMDAEYIFFNYFMGRVDEQAQRLCEHLLAIKATMGLGRCFIRAWTPGNTIEAYFA